MWTIFLLATLALPRLAEEKTPHVSALESAGTPARFMRAPLQPTGFRR
jgi:hypothetical protein